MSELVLLRHRLLLEIFELVFRLYFSHFLLLEMFELVFQLCFLLLEKSISISNSSFLDWR